MTGTNGDVASTHVIVLPGDGYAVHAPHEAEPIARSLGRIGLQASVFRYPLNVRILLGEDASPELRRSTSLDALASPPTRSRTRCTCSSAARTASDWLRARANPRSGPRWRARGSGNSCRP